jgi:hypothetical protein
MLALKPPIRLAAAQRSTFPLNALRASVGRAPHWKTLQKTPWNLPFPPALKALRGKVARGAIALRDGWGATRRSRTTTCYNCKVETVASRKQTAR